MNKVKFVVISFIVVLWSANANAQSKHSCSTYMIAKGDSILIGHNLDDYIEVPGIVVINKRNVHKTNISYKDIRKGWKNNSPRISWISKYGSITYNTMGREMIDGGLNEAGFYIGEMTLMETQFPTDETTPKIYHNFWMQYFLDNYGSVDEMMQNLDKVMIDGHCKWHFFVADKQGNSATIEFLDGKTVIHVNQTMPHKILCNSTYSSDLDSLKLYQGYGGERPINLNDKENTKRTVRATEFLNLYEKNPQKPMVEAGFELLSLLDLGNNKWQVLYDLSTMKMYFRSYKSELVKELSFSSFDFTNGNPQLFLDIHTNIEGDVSNNFSILTDKISKQYIRDFWWEVNMGWFGNIFIKPFVVRMFGGRMTGYTSTFYKNE